MAPLATLLTQAPNLGHSLPHIQSSRESWQSSSNTHSSSSTTSLHLIDAAVVQNTSFTHLDPWNCLLSQCSASLVFPLIHSSRSGVAKVSISHIIPLPKAFQKLPHHNSNKIQTHGHGLPDPPSWSLLQPNSPAALLIPSSLPALWPHPRPCARGPSPPWPFCTGSSSVRMPSL